MSSNIIVDQPLCHVNDIENEDMKSIDVTLYVNEEGDAVSRKVILVKHKNEFYCIGDKCSHFQLPLINGVLYNGRLRCFAHGAAFDVKTGDIEDYPGPDCLPKYNTYIDTKTNMVHIKDSLKKLKEKKRVASDALWVSNEVDNKLSSAQNLPKVVVIGSGAAGQLCVDTLIRAGHGKNVKLITADSCPPYDRTKLSKTPGEQADKLLLRNQEYYNRNSIDLILNQSINKVDFVKKTVHSESGKEYAYDKLVIATGFLANTANPNTPGYNLKGIFSLRTIQDANTLDSHFKSVKQENTANNKKTCALIIGGGFIGMELASYFTGKADTVTVLCRSTPFSAHFGEQIGTVVKSLHEKKGVVLKITKNDIEEYLPHESDPQRIGSIKLIDGSIYSADICIIAIGGKPMTSFLKDTSIKMTSNNLIIVDEFMQTSVDSVYAAGDITSFPRSCLSGFEDINKISNKSEANIAHWGFAMLQGRCAAESIIKSMDEKKPVKLASKCSSNSQNGFKILPFFWSANHGQSIRYAGFSQEHDEIIFHPDPAGKNELKCAAFYLLKNHVVAVCTIGWDPVCAEFAEAKQNGIVILKDHVSTNKFNLKSLLSQNAPTSAQMTKNFFVA
jgi:apoptosis-inducing factor 3